jgi:glycosyltransferase involved in cell wall biosynthesis
MHILKIIHGYPPEYNAGSEVYSQSICNELSKKNEVTLFSREENEYEPDFSIRATITEHGIPHFRVNMARSKDGYNHPILNEKFRRLIENIKPDIAHIGHLNHLSIGIIDELHHQKIPILFTLHDFWLMCPRGQFLQRNFDGNTMYRLCEKQIDTNCADSCYSMYYSGINSEFDKSYWTNWIHTRMESIRKLVEKTDLFLAPSKYLMNRFINDFHIPEERIVYLDYGFPTHYLQPLIPSLGKTYTFGYIGTHITAKGINLLIEAFSQLRGDVKLKIFGRTIGQSTAALFQMTKKSQNPIEFCGEYINHNLATTVFNTIDCIVVPSIWAENSPLVIHEAQACRIPIITADFGGMKEYVSHKKNGLLFKHRDIQSLFEQMEFASNHPKQMREFGKQGYLYSKNGQVQTIEEHCEILSNYYKKLIQNGK